MRNRHRNLPASEPLLDKHATRSDERGFPHLTGNPAHLYVDLAEQESEICSSFDTVTAAVLLGVSAAVVILGVAIRAAVGISKEKRTAQNEKRPTENA